MFGGALCREFPEGFDSAHLDAGILGRRIGLLFSDRHQMKKSVGKVTRLATPAGALLLHRLGVVLLGLADLSAVPGWLAG